MPAFRPAYLIHGDDHGRIAERRTRLRAMAEQESGVGGVELRGRATIEEDLGRVFDTGLSWKYDGRDPDPDEPGAVRLIIRLEVDKATGYAA